VAVVKRIKACALPQVQRENIMIISPLFKLMADKQASDMFFTSGAPIQIKINGTLMPVNDQRITPDQIRAIAYELMSAEQTREFEERHEMNFARRGEGGSGGAIGNFRINIFQQRNTIGIVVRFIKPDIPAFDTLDLPPVLKEVIMEKLGLILIVGSTGSGKSTTMASMIDYRNANRPGHILTIEDPVEFAFRHKKSIVNQREVHIDTHSFEAALISAMREAPDLLMIGEVRDRETLQAALLFAQTGHLCMTTLHANNSYNALNRIINFFPREMRDGLLADMAVAIRCVISQRLVRTADGRRVPAVEVLLNTKFVQELIHKGEIGAVKEAMENSMAPGSQTFEQALFKHYVAGTITLDEALANSDSPTNLRWLIDNAMTSKSDKSAPAQAAASASLAQPTNDIANIKLNLDALN
jgi:twitching motility protein PilU